MGMQADDCTYMHQALLMARKGLGRTAPNPPVGAVIVKGNRIIGAGYHPAAGQAHAEIYALKACTEVPRGATMYVTLEPCCHFGKTPPCTQAIIAAGITRVVIGVRDPNPVVAGKGMDALVSAGIEVAEGVCRPDSKELIRWYAHWISRRRPFVIVKAAMTLDARIATLSGDSKWISCEASRLKVHAWRNEVDAVLVGIGTVLKDDPQLTCRIVGGRDPVRIILDQDLLIPLHAKCLGGKCIVISGKELSERPDLTQGGTKVVHLGLDAAGALAWTDILDHPRRS